MGVAFFMHIKIFISPDCPKCVSAKKLADDLLKLNHNVEIYDVSTIDGLAEAAYHSVQETPHIIIDKEEWG